jgi:hypothetical protein
MARWFVRRVTLAVLAVVTTVTLLAGLVGVVTHDPNGSGAGVAERDESPRDERPNGQAQPGRRAALDAAVLELQSFVERQRGLRFKQPVDSSLLDDKAFRKRVTESDEDDDEEVEKAEAVLRGLGLLKSGVDLGRALDEFAAAAVVGFYDSEEDQLVVRGGSITPFVRSTLVHELTHALDDQHFNLHRPDLEDEASIGFASLAEGSALRVERDYLRTLSLRERAEAAAEEAGHGKDLPSDLPTAVQVALAFPYAEGPALVAALVRAGGVARLDAAFSAPPASSEHVLSPERYFRGDPPRKVPVPPSDREPFDEGEIGQLFLILMLRAELDDSVAYRAAEGWGGDRYVAWKDGSRTCVRMDFVMDTPADTDELVRSLSAWARERPAGSASSSGTSATSCG